MSRLRRLYSYRVKETPLFSATFNRAVRWRAPGFRMPLNHVGIRAVRLIETAVCFPQNTKTSNQSIAKHHLQHRVQQPDPYTATMSVTLHTSHGDIKVEVFCESVPKTAEVTYSNPPPSLAFTNRV